MKNVFGCWVSSLGLVRRSVIFGRATLLVLWLCAGIANPVKAQDLRAKAEAEGNLMMYATFTAADSKTLLDGFKQAYPKIDVAYYRSNDSALDGAIP